MKSSVLTFLISIHLTLELLVENLNKTTTCMAWVPIWPPLKLLLTPSNDTQSFRILIATQFEFVEYIMVCWAMQHPSRSHYDNSFTYLFLMCAITTLLKPQFNFSLQYDCNTRFHSPSRCSFSLPSALVLLFTLLPILLLHALTHTHHSESLPIVHNGQ